MSILKHYGIFKPLFRRQCTIVKTNFFTLLKLITPTTNVVSFIWGSREIFFFESARIKKKPMFRTRIDLNQIRIRIQHLRSIRIRIRIRFQVFHNKNERNFILENLISIFQSLIA